MTYNVVKDFTLGEKTYKAGEKITISDEQISALPKETHDAFNEVIARGDVVEGEPETLPVPEPSVEPGVPSETVNEGKALASAEPEQKSSADASVSSAKDSAPQPTQPASGSPWVGKHTVGGGVAVGKGGSLFTRDPKLSGK